MLSKRLKIDFLALAVILLLVTITGIAHAAAKTVLLAFDRSQLCCLMNHMTLEEKLTAIDGISKAIFHERKREVTVVYDDSKLTIPAIIDRLADITKVDKEIIFVPAEK